MTKVFDFNTLKLHRREICIWKKATMFHCIRSSSNCIKIDKEELGGEGAAAGCGGGKHLI